MSLGRNLKMTKGFFLLLPGGNYKPAVRQTCPGLWFWNVGATVSRDPPKEQSRHPSRRHDGSCAAGPVPRARVSLGSSAVAPWLGDGGQRTAPGTCGFKEAMTFWRCSWPGAELGEPLRRGRDRTHLRGTSEAGTDVNVLPALREQWLLFLGSPLPISKSTEPGVQQTLGYCWLLSSPIL